MYTENTWQKPTARAGLWNTGMNHILSEYIKNSPYIHLTIPIGYVEEIIVHSYKETGTALTVNVELRCILQIAGYPYVKFCRLVL